MNNSIDPSNSGLGLLANGSSGDWDVAVDESFNGEEWSLEIDGPQTYLVFQLQDLQVIRSALDLLQSRPLPAEKRGSHERSENESGLALGRFGSASVSLLWDNEDFPRCFIVVDSKDRSTLRLSLEGEDLQKFIESLRQVVKGLP